MLALTAPATRPVRQPCPCRTGPYSPTAVAGQLYYNSARAFDDHRR